MKQFLNYIMFGTLTTTCWVFVSCAREGLLLALVFACLLALLCYAVLCFALLARSLAGLCACLSARLFPATLTCLEAGDLLLRV